MRRKINVLAILLLICGLAYGQMDDYNYRRVLKKDTGQWHRLTLPDELFGKVNENLSDIRVYGLTENNDTIEAPYLLLQRKGQVMSREVGFETINVSRNDEGHYFTFEVGTEEAINQLLLNFEQKNFDWRIRLEGSHGQHDWFTVVDDYRILSIQNEQTDFQFTQVKFSAAKYRYFRLFVESASKPQLIAAKLIQHEEREGKYNSYDVKKITTNENKKTKQTEIDVELPLPVRVSSITVDVRDGFDYYRPVTIKYLSDSVKTAKGWKYNYRTLTAGVLNSIQHNEFEFSSKTTQRLKVIVSNQDNQPLLIEGVRVKGHVHELIVRLSEPATYSLVYGRSSDIKPRYDIELFKDKIPEAIPALTLGKELIIDKPEIGKPAPLFKRKSWLWVIMIMVMVTLGWFSLKMMKEQ